MGRDYAFNVEWDRRRGSAAFAYMKGGERAFAAQDTNVRLLLSGLRPATSGATVLRRSAAVSLGKP
jgi:hypothetical protein